VSRNPGRRGTGQSGPGLRILPIDIGEMLKAERGLTWYLLHIQV